MVRGTYLPLPVTVSRRVCTMFVAIGHTSLREESAEALIWVGRLTLFSQIPIGLFQVSIGFLCKSCISNLDSLLKAVQLNENSVYSFFKMSTRRWLTSQQELAIWQPAWPTKSQKLVFGLENSLGGMGPSDPWLHRSGKHTVETNDLPHAGWIMDGRVFSRSILNGLVNVAITPWIQVDESARLSRLREVVWGRTSGAFLLCGDQFCPDLETTTLARLSLGIWTTKIR